MKKAIKFKGKCSLFVTVIMTLAQTAVAETIEVGTAEELVSELTRLGSGDHTIKLRVGDYRLTGDPMLSDSTGESSLFVANGVRLVGLGATPDKVKLIGTGGRRVMKMAGKTAMVENLTITNGCATTTSNDTNRGGGIYGNGTVTNCIICGCSAKIGGGAQAGTYLWNTLLTGNTATSSGGGFHNGYAYGCRVEGNVSKGDGGGAYTAKELVDCVFVGNTAENANGGGAYEVTYATNCIFVGNSAKRGAGVGAGNSASAGASHLWDCVITNNKAKATGYGGGAYRATLHGCLVAGNTSAGQGGGTCHCSLYDCVVSNNTATAGSGGGISFVEMSQVDLVYMASNCLIYANTCANSGDHAYGGGVFGMAGEVIDSKIVGNCAWSSSGKIGTGGGAGQTILRSCTVHDNYSDSYGGGIRGGRAVGCRFYNNAIAAGSNGANAYNSRLERCDIADECISYGSAFGCVFHDVGTETCALTNNPHKFGFEHKPAVVWDHYPNATNCLFTGNRASSQMFSGVDNASEGATLVNCTVAGNVCDYTFGYFRSENWQLKIVNCVFAENYRSYGTRADLWLHPTSVTNIGLRLSHVMFGPSNISDTSKYSDDPSTIWAIDSGTSFRFEKERNPEHPYALRTSSPLRGKGEVQSWMADATDIRGPGFSRVRNGLVDLGCYQCWLDPAGHLLIFR